MHIQSIEPTPSPNTMKLTLSESLGDSTRNSYTVKNKEEAPSYIQQLFDIDGVKGVYHVADFIAIDRHPKKDWKQILPKVREVFGEDQASDSSEESGVNEHFGEVNVFVQMFKGIPMQIKLTDGEQEKREGLPDRFTEAITKVQKPEDNVVLERKWVEKGVRYGELDQVAKEVADELAAAYSSERLQALIALASGNPTEKEAAFASRFIEVTPEMLNEDDWKKRYAVLERMDPKEKDIPVLEKALDDEKASIRRLATVYFGMIEKDSVLPYLYKALKDSSVTVRRTAGDCLSDIGSDAAIPAMIEALEDKNKLVRWRAAMFLYEVGNETAIPALKKAEADEEFEVALQVKMALERIEGGQEAKGSVWKQMTDARKHEG
ncbi:conserved virulence factor C family protein [Alkalihalobacillus hemicellulosilyticus]|uniref:PBS lyase HEAT-like repeat domain protein n=1 Tax=Halalkalibacter hemicellulosilyticusJCM 9152 TaxID=1236971 RepID=W4QCI0_9BACI|nr:conserved virulence factor C family protein [Halalkalibacter hemicellulosilyticus]GAE29079.1 PBS lyase HEAT-like repeat domain protein [Halalkalibacter hemicellulosilyticusJCM 9152]